MSDDELVAMLEDDDTEKQILALMAMRTRISDNGEPLLFFYVAKNCIGSTNNKIRWQSLIVVGEYIQAGFLNEEIWALVLRHCGQDEDMQIGLATVLLEHLLEYDFESMFSRVAAEVQAGNAPVVDLLERCWVFGEAERHWHRVEQLIDAFRATNPDN